MEVDDQLGLVGASGYQVSDCVDGLIRRAESVQWWPSQWDRPGSREVIRLPGQTRAIVRFSL